MENDRTYFLFTYLFVIFWQSFTCKILPSHNQQQSSNWGEGGQKTSYYRLFPAYSLEFAFSVLVVSAVEVIHSCLYYACFVLKTIAPFSLCTLYSFNCTTWVYEAVTWEHYYHLPTTNRCNCKEVLDLPSNSVESTVNELYKEIIEQIQGDNKVTTT